MIRLACAGFTAGALSFLTLFLPTARTTTSAHWAWLVGRPSSYGDLSRTRNP